jgi:hypothetical protein
MHGHGLLASRRVAQRRESDRMWLERGRTRLELRPRECPDVGDAKVIQADRTYTVARIKLLFRERTILLHADTITQSTLHVIIIVPFTS